MFKHNITALLNKQRPDKSGRYPLRIRTTIKRKVTYYPTSIMLKLDEWNNTKKEIVKVSNRVALNALLKKKMADIESEILEASLLGESAGNVKGKVLTFKEYAEKKIREAKRSETADTIKHKQSYLRKFENFKPGLKLAQVTAEVLRKFENHCKDIGNTDNTVWSSTKFVLSVINAAVKDGYLAASVQNFSRTKYQNPERTWLSAAEINKMEKYIAEHPDSVFAKAANWFLFSCYSGLRYGDLSTFNPDKIKAGKIILRTAKAGTDVTIKIHPRLKVCIDRMDFKVTTNQDYNRLLKALSEILKIKKRLTSHIARHTFAVQFLEGGGSMEVLSKILGHTSLKTTAIYGQITNIRIDQEINRVFG